MTPGPILGMPEKEYRAHEAISQSLLKSFGEAATPLHFKAAKPKEATADMLFGTCAHAAILEPHRAHEVWVVRPEEYPSEKLIDGKPVMKPWNGNSTWCETWLANQGDKIVLTREQAERLPKIVDSLNKIELVREALKHGQKEVSWFKQDEETGLWLKARTDLVAMDAEQRSWILDLKKTQSGCATHDEFSKSAADYGYDIQAASYLSITGASRFIFVVFDDKEPYDVSLFEPTAEMLNAGRARWLKLLAGYNRCVQSNDWPGYQKTIQPLNLPAWANKKEL